MPYSNCLLRKKTQLFLRSFVLLFHLGATESISKKAQNFDKKILNFDERCKHKNSYQFTNIRVESNARSKIANIKN